MYKLQEIDEKYRLLKPGQRVMDLGCSPGSWLQYISKKIGPKGYALGVDIKPVGIQIPANVEVVQKDVADLELKGLPNFDLVVSDMAPATTGIRFTDSARSVELVEIASKIASTVLKEGGWFLAKIFQGASTDDFLKSIGLEFESIKLIKPKGSRKESVEIFLLTQKK